MRSLSTLSQQVHYCIPLTWKGKGHEAASKFGGSYELVGGRQKTTFDEPTLEPTCSKTYKGFYEGNVSWKPKH